MPIVTTSWLQLTLIGTKICQNTSILWNIRLYNSLRTSWSGFRWNDPWQRLATRPKKNLTDSHLACWHLKLSWGTILSHRIHADGYTLHSIQYTDGFTVGCGLPSLHCFLPSPVATPIPQFTWHLTLFTWPDASRIGDRTFPSQKVLCRARPFPDLMGCRHFCWLFLLLQSNFISSARSAF